MDFRICNFSVPNKGSGLASHYRHKYEKRRVCGLLWALSYLLHGMITNTFSKQSAASNNHGYHGLWILLCYMAYQPVRADVLECGNVFLQYKHFQTGIEVGWWHRWIEIIRHGSHMGMSCIGIVVLLQVHLGLGSHEEYKEE